MAKLIIQYQDIKLIVSTHGWSEMLSRPVKPRKINKDKINISWILNDYSSYEPIVSIIKRIEKEKDVEYICCEPLEWIPRFYVEWSDKFDNDQEFGEWGGGGDITIKNLENELKMLVKEGKIGRIFQRLKLSPHYLQKVPQLRKKKLRYLN